MRKDVIKCMALYMSMLIIMLPLYISNVYAADTGSVINVLSIKGADGIKGIRKSSGDFTKVDVEVFSSTPLTAQNIQLKSTAPGAASTTFQTCSDISPYMCTWQSQTGNLPAGSYSYYACIGNCNSCYQSSCKKKATIYVDGVAPTVETLSADRQMTNGGAVKLHYKITDRSCLASVCSGKCSGISKAELYDLGEDGTKTSVGTISINSDSCTYENDYNFISSSMANGERRLCMVAYDRFMQNSSLNLGAGCIEMKKDNFQPSYNTVRLMDQTESYDVKFVGDAGTTSKLVINLTTSALLDLKDRSLTGDLTQIGGSNEEKIPCSDLGNGKWACSKLVNAKAVSGSSSVQISAVDEGGNNNTQTFSFSLTSDSAAPVVDSITTGNEISKVPYLRGGLNVIYAIITETGSGMSFSKAYFGVGDSNRATCSPAGDKWVCYANITASGAAMVVNVHGEDDAGNAFASAKNLLIDSMKPSLGKVILTNTNSNPYFVTQDDMVVKAYIHDDRGVVGDSGAYNIYMTPSGFADPNPVKAESCEKNESSTNVICQWTIMNMAPGKVKINFNISDFVGNSISMDKSRFNIEYLEPATGNYTLLPDSQVEVYDVEGKAADYWTSSPGTSMPETVDSSTTELIEHSVWIPVQLRPRASAALFSVELSGCSSPDFSNYAKEAALIRPTPRSDRPFLRVTLKRGAIETEQMTFGCALNIISKHNGKISQVEVEPFNATVLVVSHGEFSNQVLFEIMRTARGWLVRASWIEPISKIISLFTKICSLIQSVSTAIRDVTLLLHLKTTICETNPFCWPGAKAARFSLSGIKKGELGLWGATYQFCAYVSCSKTIWGKWLQGDKGFDLSKYNKLAEEGKLPGDAPGTLTDQNQDAVNQYIQDRSLGLSGRLERGVNSHLQAQAPVSAEQLKGYESAYKTSDETFISAQTEYDTAKNKVYMKIPVLEGNFAPTTEQIEEEIKKLEGGDKILSTYYSAQTQRQTAQTKFEQAKKIGTDSSSMKALFFGTQSDSLQAMPEAERKKLGIQGSGLVGGLTAWGNPQNSLILSIATGCIPGIFLNLQKARQIECQYLSCIVNDVPAGMPLAACTKVRNFQWCMFIFGEIFQVIPFLGSIKNILSPILSMLKDPLTLIFGIMGYVCEFHPSDSLMTACHLLNSINSVINIVKTMEEIMNSKDLFNLKGTDSCKETLAKADGIIQKSLGVATGTTTGAANVATAAG
ncbi:hypothetical protein COV19_02985 [Candidatus Woesearchaeota archaeon CG10_big_fil_rev_8_21_14_0_10_44_13]|nr:MAG: hypothetical protein COV19_02985 [Candidatus Woesearchaeota archaeon CG10_big_fil_rev_8_21_14_0_10_44_13]